MAAVLTEAGRGAARSRRPTWPLLAVLVGGALVAVSLGAYAGLHAPARRETVSLFFSGTLPFKAWTTTAILGLTVFQAVSALRLYGRLSWPRELPAWLGGAHRLSGTLAFIASLPVAFHRLWAMGLAPPTNLRGVRPRAARLCVLRRRGRQGQPSSRPRSPSWCWRRTAAPVPRRQASRWASTSTPPRA